MSEAEIAVRRYLQFLEDPSTARDEAVVAAAQARLDSAKDVIERLKALTAVEHANAADGEEIRAGFVRHARAWANAEGVTVSAFRQMNVPSTALAEAGLLDSSAGVRKVRTSATAARAAKAARAPRVGIHSIQDAIPEGTFTLADLMERAGGSPATVRKAVDALIANGIVERVGSDPSHSSRGRAPILYRKS